jgi:hypothetical protein
MKDIGEYKQLKKFNAMRAKAAMTAKTSARRTLARKPLD